MIKSFRITSRKNRGVSRIKMYFIIFLILMFHTLIANIWLRYDMIGIESTITNDYKEYNKCSYPKILTIW